MTDTYTHIADRSSAGVGNEGSVKGTSAKQLVALIVFALSLASLTVGVAASPASAGTAGTAGTAEVARVAAYADCPSSYVCWFRGRGGTGQKWQFRDRNLDITRYGVYAQSGYNHGSEGFRACGFNLTRHRVLNFSAVPGETKSFTARTIASNAWTRGFCSDYPPS
jgi:hypothetical protein